MNILECTIKMKRETRAHYQRLAETVSDVELKRLFSLLAAAEDEHVDKLVALQNDMKKLNVKNFNRLEESVCVYSPHIDPRHLAEALRHDPDAYRHVVQEEEETIDFDCLGKWADGRREFRRDNSSFAHGFLPVRDRRTLVLPPLLAQCLGG